VPTGEVWPGPGSVPVDIWQNGNLKLFLALYVLQGEDDSCGYSTRGSRSHQVLLSVAAGRCKPKADMLVPTTVLSPWLDLPSSRGWMRCSHSLTSQQQRAASAVDLQQGHSQLPWPPDATLCSQQNEHIAGQLETWHSAWRLLWPKMQKILFESGTLCIPTRSHWVPAGTPSRLQPGRTAHVGAQAAHRSSLKGISAPVP
jgi:hypothetical protein